MNYFYLLFSCLSIHDRDIDGYMITMTIRFNNSEAIDICLLLLATKDLFHTLIIRKKIIFIFYFPVPVSMTSLYMCVYSCIKEIKVGHL